MEVVYGPRLRLPGYVCGECGKGKRKKVKLWRPIGPMAPRQEELRCVDCACRLTGVDPRSVNGAGQHYIDGVGMMTVMGSTYILAVPSEVEGDRIVNYWARFGVPEGPHAWWVALPLR